MALALGLSFEFNSKATYGADVRSCASSRTLTPLGARSDAGLEEIDTGSLTPPTPSHLYIRNTARNGTGKTLNGTELEELDAGSLTPPLNTLRKTLQDQPREEEREGCDIGVWKILEYDAIEPVTMQAKIFASDVEMPEPVKTTMTMTQVAPALSKGSVGHPYTCGTACKYFRRKDGCHDGANCKKCHACQWSRKPEHQKAVAEGDVPLRVAVLGGTEFDTEDGPASIGSIGHPFSCKQACKYQSKKSGCKDGKLCSRCHLCHWRRRCERAVDESEESELFPQGEFGKVSTFEFVGIY